MGLGQENFPRSSSPSADTFGTMKAHAGTRSWGIGMLSYTAREADLAFLLFDLFQAPERWAAAEGTAHLDADLAQAILGEGGRLASEVFSPLMQSGDSEGCRFEKGQVYTPAGFKAAYEAYAQGGWMGLAGDPAFGGQGMPKQLCVALEEMFFAANASLYLYPALSAGACVLLAAHGSEAQKAEWLPPLYEGRFSGTMCLTEPHAGSDLSLLRTRAEPQGDGSFSVSGSKIFITGGEQDLTENIVHFVLARTPDAPPGNRGLSLFLVPKFLLNAEGTLGNRNAVAVGSIEHKMGIKGSATCVMNFDGARAWLVGEEGRGLAAMFTMMNYERLSIGLQGLGTADLAFQNALAYAKERRQGRDPQGGSAAEADSLLVHPDVRRMLLTQKAFNEGGRAFASYVAMMLDQARYGTTTEARAEGEAFAAFLTPIAKAFLSDRGLECCVLGQQVLGGHGYLAEWGLEQCVRDTRIAQIYEGTNGIQAMDLADRKTAREQGRTAMALLASLRAACLTEGPWVQEVSGALDTFERATEALVAGAAEDPTFAGAVAADYLELAGLVLYACLWQRMVPAAVRAAEAGRVSEGFAEDKRSTGAFFMAKLLPKISLLEQTLKAGSAPLMAAAL